MNTTIYVMNEKTKEVVYKVASQADVEAACVEVSNAFAFKLADLSLTEMVKVNNRNGGKEVSKFRDRAAGEERLDELLESFPTFAGAPVPDAPAAPRKGKGKKAAPKPSPKGENVPAKPAKAPRKAKGVIDDAPTAPKARNNGAGVTESWKRKDVYAKRITRHRVSVNGTEYRSTMQAFQALDLPLGGHIKFRIALKEAGSATFEHNNEKYKFKAYKQEA